MSEQLLCTGCNLSKTCLSPCMPGRGAKSAAIMVVGEAGGEEEDRQGLPFVGPSGRFLRRHLLRGSGIEEEDLFITNAVRCRPQANKKPTIAHVRTCRHFLEDEIRQVKPKVILLLGNVALHSLVNIYKGKEGDDQKKSSGLSGISQWRGIKLWSREFNCWLVPTYHPAALVRDLAMGITYREDQTIEDFELAAYLAAKPLPVPKYPVSYRVKSPEKALEVLEYMQRQPEVAFDIETEDLDTATEILGVSVADSDQRGFYITAIADKRVKQAISKLLTNPNIIKVMHNGAFDQRFLRTKGYPAAVNWQDTMIAASLVDENFAKGLKPLAWRYTMFGGYDKELDDYRRVNKLKTYAGIPESVMAPYAAYDACATFHLYKLFGDELKTLKTTGLYTGVLMPVRNVLNDIEITGFKVDVKRAEELNKLCDKAVEQFSQQVYKLAGEEFNIRSTPQLGNILFNKLGLKPLKATGKKGKKPGASATYSCDKASMVFIAKQRKGQIAQVILDMKYIQSQQSKFINLILKHVRPDGRIHTTYNSTGTVTGRLSCSRPGIHNVPRDRLIRSIYTASPGNVLVEADVKSAELRALAVYSGETFLIDAFNAGRDLHTETYIMMFDKPADYKPTDDERFIAKAINFGLVYGRGAKALGEVLGVSTAEAQRLIDLYFSRMPKVKAYLDNCVAGAHKRGYVTSLFGRRRRLPLINADDFEVVSHAERQAKNSPVQSAAADYTYIVLKRVSAAMKKHNVHAKIVHTVHDCLIIDSPPDEADFLVETIKRAYSHPVREMPIKMEMDVDVVNVWGEHKDSVLEGVLVKAGVIKATKKAVKSDDDLIFDDEGDGENDE